MGDSRRPPRQLAELLIPGPSPRPILPGILGHQVCARRGPGVVLGHRVSRGRWDKSSGPNLGHLQGTVEARWAFGTGSSPCPVWMKPPCLWQSHEVLPELDSRLMPGLSPRCGHHSLVAYGDSMYSDYVTGSGSCSS